MLVETVDAGTGGVSLAMTVKKKATVAAVCPTTVHLIAKNGSSIEGRKGRDGVFYGRDRYALLSGDGLGLEIVSSLTGTRSSTVLGSSQWNRIFNGGAGEDLMYFSATLGILCFAASDKTPDLSRAFETHRFESVIQVEWHSLGPLQTMVALIATTERLLIVDAELEPLAQLNTRVDSAVWADSVVVFSRRDSRTIDYLCLDGFSHSLASTHDLNPKLCGMFPTRLIFVAPSVSGTQIKSVAIWPFECLANGILGLPGASAELKKELMDSLIDSIDFYTCTSPDLVLRLQKLGMTDAAARILANAPQMYEMMKTTGEWTDTEAVDALEPLVKRAEAPDHLDAWLPQKLDFYRGGPAEFVAPVTGGQDETQMGEQAIAAPVGFVPIIVSVCRLPSLNSSTRVSSFLSTSRTTPKTLLEAAVAAKLAEKQAHLNSSANSSVSTTPVLSARRPPPQSALPAIPASPSASQALIDPIRLDESSEEEEDEVDDEADSSHGSPLLGRQQSVLIKAATWEGAASPIVPRESQPGDAPLVLSSSPAAADVGTNSFADIMNTLVGTEEEDSALSNKALASADEAVAYYDLGLLQEALGQATESLTLFGKTSNPEKYLTLIRRTAAFKQLLIILIQLEKQEAGSPKIAFYSTLAASLEFIDVEHRVPLIEKAISVNKEAGNARVVKMLISLHHDKLPVGISDSVEEKPVDAQEWCSYYDESSVFSPERIMTSTDQFVTCPQCLAPSLVADLGARKSCLICGLPTSK